MESNYIVVFNDPKKGKVAAAALCAALDQGAMILNSQSTHNAVHYVLGQIPEALPQNTPEEEAQIIKDNLDAKTKGSDDE